MTTSEFSPQKRVLVCVVCGATLDVPIAGGWVRCPHCHSDNQVSPRGASGTSEVSQVLAEEVRLARLRAQSGRPLFPPHSIRRLFERGKIDPARRDEALREWQRALAERAAAKLPNAPPAPEDAETRLAFLTVALYPASESDPRERRAHLEAALEQLDDPVFRHRICSQLASAATRAGDFHATEQWLTLFDRRSDDLDIHTTYRAAVAMLAMARGQYDGVVAALGTSHDDVPIADDLVVWASALRAHAHELSGRLELATEQLVEQMLRNPNAEERIAAWAENDPYLRCPQSVPLARAQLAAEPDADVVVSKGPGSGIGSLLFVVAIAAVVVVGHVLGTASLDEDGQGQAGVGAAVFLLVAALIVRSRRASVSKRLRGELRTIGIAARSRVLGRRRRLGLAGRTVVDLDLLISVPGRSRFIAKHRELLTTAEDAEAHPGNNVAVLLDPQDPRRMAIDCS